MIIIFCGLESSMIIIMIMIVVIVDKNLLELVGIKWARKQHYTLLVCILPTNLDVSYQTDKS